MKVVVCLRQSVSGDINPFDACAYEAALHIPDSQVTLLSMGPLKSVPFLTGLTRLGAERAILLSDSCFAGADTLATAYTLSLAVKKLNPDLIICGRQTVDGDTGQVGPELSVLTNRVLITNVMNLKATENEITCVNRLGEKITAKYPALITVERINILRLPSIRSKSVEVEVWTSNHIEADIKRCGLMGSPTRVIKTFENDQDRRKCTFINTNDFKSVFQSGIEKGKVSLNPAAISGKRLKNVWIVGEAPRSMAQTVSDDIIVVPIDTPQNLISLIREREPDIVLWGSDYLSKAVAPQVAAVLKTGLCADCTSLETDGNELYMYRPAFSGNIIAKIKCLTRPKMATVRTVQPDTPRVVVGIGAGVKAICDRVKKFAEKIDADIAASRVMVDNDFLPYEKQVGLTGKSINPDIYIAFGISGAVHHIAGIRQSGIIIAVNPDKSAPIFNYSDYGLPMTAEDFLDSI